MRYTIRHFDLPLFTFEANMDSADTGLHIIKVYEENRSFLPLNLTVSEDGVERWLRHRAIPKNRAYVDALLSKVGLSLNRPLGIIAANKGLSLNDCFWVDAEGSGDTFKKVNLYDNRFSQVLAAIAFTGFAAPEVEQITDTADTVVFHSKKYGAYQVQNTENGLKLSILSVPSKKEENKSRYYLFGNMIYSQIISLLYPEMLSAVQVEQEKKAVHGYLKQKKIINLVATIAVIVVIAAVASGGFNMDSIKSCGLSDSQMPSIFSANATLDEIFDTYFDDSKWDNYKEDGKKIVTYTGDRVVESGRTLRFTFYFVLNSDDTFNLDHVTSNGTELDWLQEMIILNMLNEYYLGMNKTTSTSVATRVESEVAVSDNTVWNDSENSTSDYTEEDSDDEYAYISGADKVIDEVYGTVWDGWENDDPDHPELDEITYGMVMDYLFEDSTYYSWYYDDTTGNVIMEGTYTTFDYTMGMADEPTACDVKLTFTVDNDGNWFVSDYSGDEFDTADEFLQVAYDFYYEGNRLL